MKLTMSSSSSSSKEGMQGGYIHRDRERIGVAAASTIIIGSALHHRSGIQMAQERRHNMDDPESDPNFRNLENVRFAKNSDDGS
jgi:hypothetical protein